MKLGCLNEYGIAVCLSWEEKKKKLKKKRILARMHRRDVRSVYRGASGIQEVWNVAADGGGECKR